VDFLYFQSKMNFGLYLESQAPPDVPNEAHAPGRDSAVKPVRNTQALRAFDRADEGGTLL